MARGGKLFNLTAVGDAALVARIQNMPDAVRDALRRKVEILTMRLQSHIVRNKLHGQVLNQRSGALARSIQRRVTATALAVYGFVFSAGDVKYAAIHEYGGTIKHPGGTAYIPGGGSAFGGAALFVSNSKASALAAAQGHPLPRTGPHDIPMPERSFMRTGLADLREPISRGLKEAVIEGLRTIEAP